MTTVLETVLPFTNDVANVLSSSGIKKLKGLYKEKPITNIETISKFSIDLISFIGILLTTIRTSTKYGTKVGLVKGVFELMIAFLIVPLLNIPSIMNKMCYNKCYPLIRIMIGIFVIVCVIGFEYVFDKIMEHRLEQKKSIESN